MTIFDCSDQHGYQMGLHQAHQALQAHSPIILPTDTVYGIGVQAYDQEGLAQLIAGKHRDPQMPVGVLVGSLSQMDQLVGHYQGYADVLIETFWPGPLSLILPCDRPQAQGDTIMVRMPAHQVALGLLQHVGPMAVSSANHSGQPPATTIEQAYHYFGETIEVYLNAGALTRLAPSTIVDLTGRSPRICRVGPLGADELGEVLGIDPAQLEGCS